MKKIYLLLFCFGIILLFSCNTSKYLVSTFSPDGGNGTACPAPIYIATVSKDAGVYNQEALTLASLLKDAKAAYGSDVTIQNVRWDVLSDKVTKVSVIYDVVKCK